MAFKPISVDDIPQEVKDYAQRYIDKTKVVTYMRPIAYAAFIDGALYAMGMYIQHRDKNGLKLNSEI